MTRALYLLLAIALVAAFRLVGDAALPDILTDPAQREAVEYLDGKTDSAVKITAAFSDATSTTTFSGWVDIGAETVPGTPASPVCTASCSAGNRILGGGCQGGAALVQSYPSGNTWTCQVSGTCTAYAICARVK